MWTYTGIFYWRPYVSLTFHELATTKQNKVRTVCIILEMYYLLNWYFYKWKRFSIYIHSLNLIYTKSKQIRLLRSSQNDSLWWIISMYACVWFPFSVDVTLSTSLKCRRSLTTCIHRNGNVVLTISASLVEPEDVKMEKRNHNTKHSQKCRVCRMP